MVDVVITDTHPATDRGGWVGDDLNGESAGLTDTATQDTEFLPFHTRTIGDQFNVADGGTWGIDGQGEQAGLTDSAGVEERLIVATISDPGGLTDNLDVDASVPFQFVRVISEPAGHADHGSYDVGSPTESAGLTDTTDTGGVVTVRTVADQHHATDVGQPLTFHYGITLDEDAAGLDDAVAEPDTTAPLDYVRTISDHARPRDTIDGAASWTAELSDTHAPSDTVVYMLRGRTATPEKRITRIPHEPRTIHSTAPRRGTTPGGDDA